MNHGPLFVVLPAFTCSVREPEISAVGDGAVDEVLSGLGEYAFKIF